MALNLRFEGTASAVSVLHACSTSVGHRLPVRALRALLLFIAMLRALAFLFATASSARGEIPPGVKAAASGREHVFVYDPAPRRDGSRV